jgi:twitching motility protein PilT
MSRPSLAEAKTPVELDNDSADNGELVLRILRAANTLAASDVHLRSGAPPLVRLDGDLRPLKHAPLNDHQVERAVSTLAGSAGVPPEKLTGMQADFSFKLPDGSRFRGHMYRQAGTPALVLRRIQSPIPDFASLRLPPIVKRVALADRGLVLVVGATGNGKSTTIASMMEFVNQNACKHIVTLEDPVEYVFQDHLSSFSQREVGRDVLSYDQGLLGVLREDPDIVFLGEIRTPEALEVAMNAAESGRLVLSTTHSQDTARTIARLVNMVPNDFRESLRSRLADVIVGIVAQRLIARKNSKSRILCTEVLTASPTVRDCIRDQTRFRGLTAALEAGTNEYGSHSFDQMLVAMVRDGLITPETAQASATNPADLVRNLKIMR